MEVGTRRRPRRLDAHVGAGARGQQVGDQVEWVGAVGVGDGDIGVVDGVVVHNGRTQSRPVADASPWTPTTPTPAM